MLGLPRIAKITKFAVALGIIGYFLVAQSDKIFSDREARAYGDLDVYFQGTPLFNEPNFMPGDSVTKWVNVKNNGPEELLVAVKAHNISGSEPDPILPEVLGLVITENSAELYRDSLQSFFDLSSLNLSNLASGEEMTYYFTVSFDPAAGNDYQGKQVIFDLTFGYEAEGLIINEIYYQVDEDHGSEAAKDRWNIDAQNIGNASGSVNNIWINIAENCSLVQTNFGGVNNNVDIDVNTGGNSGGAVSSGSGSIIIKIKNIFNKNVARWQCRGWGQNDEWVELYNPNDGEVRLKDWSLVDDSGFETVIHSNRKIPAHGFALLSKSKSTWRFWDEPWGTLKIALGRQIGDGLGNDGDRLLLKNPFGEVVDEVGWGDDTFVWDPAVPNASFGFSIERQPLGTDTDSPNDFEPSSPPTPGV